jgi:uncharacterized membrane protein
MKNARTIGIVLWIVQGLLALFFAGASGAPKLLLPLEMIPMPLPLPEWFVRSIGVAEVLGAVGLILPGLSRIRPGLTSLAAAALVLLTICAAGYQLLARQPENAFFALVIGLLAAFVAYGRLRLAPLSPGAAAPSTLDRDQVTRPA